MLRHYKSIIATLPDYRFCNMNLLFMQYEFIVLTYVHSIPMNAWQHFTYMRKLRHHYPQATRHRNVNLSEGCIPFSLQKQYLLWNQEQGCGANT